MNGSRAAVAIFLVAVFIFVVPVSADWLDGWDYRKSHVINNTGDALSDYQMMYTINRSIATIMEMVKA